jgi:hypothetical protein
MHKSEGGSVGYEPIRPGSEHYSKIGPGKNADQIAKLKRSPLVVPESRKERKAGGRTGKMDVNIIIATGKGQDQGGMQPQGGMPPHPMAPPPPPMPPPGVGAGPPMPPPGAMGAPQPMPMGRKSGGRARIEAGGGSGLGRLEKAGLY